MAPLPASSARRRFMRAIALLLLLNVYVLSVGPAIFFHYRTLAGGGLIEVVYAPVFWLYDHTPLRGPLDRYVGYFEELAEGWDRPWPVIVAAPTDLGHVAPEAVVAGKRVRLEASVSRDFMPCCPPNGRPMTAFFRVATVDESPFPAGVRAERAWVIYGDEAWLPRFKEPNRPTGKDHGPFLNARAFDGPRWGPGIAVDVIIQLRDEAGNVYLLGVRREEVGMTS